MQMENINNTVIQGINVKYAGAAGTVDGHTLKTSFLKRLTETAKAGNYSWSRLGQEQVRKGQGDEGKRGE